MGNSRTAIELGSQSLEVLVKLAARGAFEVDADDGDAVLSALKKEAAGIVSVHLTTMGGGRMHALACEAFDGLVEYHPQALVEDSRERIVLLAISQVTSCGHDQTDYIAMRDAIERIVEATTAAV